MTVRRMTAADLDWAVGALGRRRADLVPHAPVFWRPAAGAHEAHRRFLGYVLGGGGGIGFRTDEALLIAAPGDDRRWIIDDAVVPEDRWTTAGRLLWDALADEISGQPVRFVCPTHESQRGAFARARGLDLAYSWWHAPVAHTRAAVEDGQPRVDHAIAELVPAPPVYDPGGPVLLLREITHPAPALSAAHREACRLGSPVIVVDQPAADQRLAAALTEAGYRRHCDFFEGIIGRG